MDVTDEDAQMDLSLHWKFWPEAHLFFAEPDQEKHNVSQKHIDLSISSNVIIFYGKSEDTILSIQS